VVTEHNTGWTFARLHENLAEEHRAMLEAKKSIHTEK